MANRPDKDKDQSTQTQQDEGNKTGTPPAQTEKTGKSIPAYLAAALRLASSRPLGAPTVDTNIARGNNEAPIKSLKPIPGAMVLDYVPTLGVSKDATSAVNRAAFNEFNAIRSQISGNRPYEPADHMIYRACVDSMHDLYRYVKRIYKIISKYSATNLYRPRTILKAMGLNADDWIANAASLYQWLVVHAGSMAPFPTVPMGSITARHNTFNDYLYTDGDIESSQTYVINQVGFWSYELVDEVKGITTRVFPKTFSAFQEMWDDMYAALQGSSDVYIIAADIRRAFGDKVVTTMEAPGVTDQVEYVKLDPVLTSIMNATVPGIRFSGINDAAQLSQFRIYDEDGIIKCIPKLSMQSDGSIQYIPAYFNHINMVESNPSELAILNAVRFKPVMSVDNTNSYPVEYLSMGTEVIVGARIATQFYEAGDDTSIDYVSGLVYYNYAELDTSKAVPAIARLLSRLSTFDWHPPVAIAGGSFSSGEFGTDTAWIVEDIQNYIPVSDEDLTNIHDANLLAEFGLA